MQPALPDTLGGLCRAAALLACVCLTCWFGSACAAPARTDRATTAPQLVLGINNGVRYGNQIHIQAIGVPFAQLLSKATQQNVIWDGSFDASSAQAHGSRFAFAFVKPPSLTAQLLAKGWHLVAVASDPDGFGTDLIAQPCPGKPGQVALGGQNLAVLGLSRQVPSTCVPVAQVWTSPSAVLLSPENSLVEQVGEKVWRTHNGKGPQLQARVRSQDAVVGLMEQMHTAVVGAVNSVFGKQWQAKGGVLLQHQPMPFWAVIAAPDTPAEQIAAVRAALMDTSAAAPLNRVIGIKGWESGDPKRYADFLKWLKD